MRRGAAPALRDDGPPRARLIPPARTDNQRDARPSLDVGRLRCENRRMNLARLEARRNEVLSIAAAHGAHNVRVFGSLARGDSGPDSDIDLLVDLEPGRGLLDHAALMLDVEDLFGRKVDVAVERGLRPAVRQRVLAEAKPL